MEIIHAVVLAVVEGITEFLPVSSTGHMILASHIMQMPQTDFLKTFEIAIQLGAIGAVFSMYWRVFLLDWETVAKVLAAFIPTAVIGFLLYKSVKHLLMGNIIVVGFAFLIGGIFLIIFELLYKGRQGKVKTLSEVTYPQALAIGLCQSVAVIPGVSRSAATIVGGLMLGISRKVIVEFSFLLAVPTMMAATALDLLKSHAAISKDEVVVLAVGFFTAMAVAFFAVKMFVRFVQRHDFIPFGVYRIIVGIAVLWYFGRV